MLLYLYKITNHFKTFKMDIKMTVHGNMIKVEAKCVSPVYEAAVLCHTPASALQQVQLFAKTGINFLNRPGEDQRQIKLL
jgi:hypothetical protein